jgi:IclR family transcriptional regulator, KDG regulon repressor
MHSDWSDRTGMSRVKQNDQREGRVQALDLALRMLEQLAFTGKPGRVTDLARLLGTSKNRVHRHLQTLVDMGYVVRDSDTQRYAVGIRLVQLGSAVANQYDLLSVSRPIMQRVRDRLGLTVVLSKVIAHQLYAIERVYGTSDVTVGVVIGSPLGLHSSAQGKIVLAFGDTSLLEAVTKSRLDRRTSNTIVDPARLRREVATIRKQGWASAPGETMTGLNAFAVPILDGAGQLFGTLALIGLADELPATPSPRHLAELSAAAGSISAALFGEHDGARRFAIDRPRVTRGEGR